MAAPHLTHDIVCIGPHDPRPHDFHAANARAVHHLFTGGLAPPRAISQCLAGSQVRLSVVSDTLDAAVERGATNLVVYFSGRGDRVGLHVSDGAIEPGLLDRLAARSRAQAVLLVLDLAIGAEPDQALLPDWLRSLVAERKGFRAAVARATRVGAGVEGEGLGRFTSAFISALESAPGELRFERVKYISDKLAMEHARALMAHRWGTTDFPIMLGDLGDLPLARSQAFTNLGRASIESLTPGAGLSVAVKWTIEGRANMKTTLHFQLVRQPGTVIGEGSTEIVAKDPVQKGKTHVRLPKGSVARPRSVRQLDLSAAQWRMSLRDARGRVLAESSLDLG